MKWNKKEETRSGRSRRNCIFFLIGCFMQRGVAKREMKNKTKEKNVGDDGF